MNLQWTPTIALALLTAVPVLWLRLRAVKREGEARQVAWAEDAADRHTAFVALHRGVMDALRDPYTGEIRTRHEIRLADWGPDFTGYDGILPRWRWAVLDADRDVKAALGLPVETGTEEMPFMLGNSFTSEAAFYAAVDWVERQQHPLHLVVLADQDPA